MELVGLDHYAINVADLKRSADWYKKAFGFTVLHKWQGPDVWMVGRGNIKVGLFFTPKAAPPPDLETLFVIKHVAFLVDGDKFVAAQDWLRRAGIPFEPPEDTDIAYSIFVRDPDNNCLELTTYHPAAAPVARPR
jgi:catechol 2,3-dioxygenase-like lactoylglutathione lyase family enzyme